MKKIIFNPCLAVFVVLLIALAAVALMVSCGGGGGVSALIGGPAAILGSIGLSSSPVVGVSSVFLGDSIRQPAAVLPFTSEAQAVAVTPDGKKVVLTDSLHNTVSIIDTESRRVTAVLDVRTNPIYAAISPDGKKAYISNFGISFQNFDNPPEIVPEKTVSVVDLEGEQILTHIEVAPRPNVIAFTPDGEKAYVAHEFSSALIEDAPSGVVSVIDAVSDLLIGQVQLSHMDTDINDAESLVISRDGRYLYVLSKLTNNIFAGSVAIIDTSSDEVIQIVSVGAGARSLAIDPDDQRLYVTNSQDNTLSVFDITDGTALELAVVPVAEDPGPIVVSPDGKRAYVAHVGLDGCPFAEEDPDDPDGIFPVDINEIGKTVTVIDTATNEALAQQIEVGLAPIAMVITPDSTKLYSISGCEAKLSAVETERIGTDNSLAADIIGVETRSSAIAVSEAKSEVYVVHPHAVSVIDILTDTVSGPVIPIRGDGPIQLVAGTSDDEGRFKLYALQPGSKKISIVEVDKDDFQVSKGVDLDNRPSSMTFINPKQESLLVTLSGYSKSTLFSKTLDNRVVRIHTNPYGILDVLDDGVIEVGPGPVKAVAAPSVEEDPSIERIFVAAYGHFFNNDRAPTGNLAQVELNSGDTTVGFKFGFTSVIDLVVGADQDKRGYAADFFQGAISAFNPAEDNLTAKIVTTDVKRPVSIGISGQMLYSINYRVEDEMFKFKGFDVQDSENLEKKMEIDIMGVNPSKIVFATVGAQETTAAIVLQTGDRSHFCKDDPKTFCDVGNQVTIIDLADPRVETIALGPNPDSPAAIRSRPVDAVVVDHKIFVTGYFSGDVTVIDANTVDFDDSTAPKRRVLKVGNGPSGMVVKDGRVFVANSIDNTLSVISANVDFSEVAVLDAPIALGSAQH